MDELDSIIYALDTIFEKLYNNGLHNKLYKSSFKRVCELMKRYNLCEMCAGYEGENNEVSGSRASGRS